MLEQTVKQHRVAYRWLLNTIVKGLVRGRQRAVPAMAEEQPSGVSSLTGRSWQT